MYAAAFFILFQHSWEFQCGSWKTARRPFIYLFKWTWLIFFRQLRHSHHYAIPNCICTYDLYIFFVCFHFVFGVFFFNRAMQKWYLMYVSECMTQNHFPRIYLRLWNDCGRILVFKNASHEATNINLMIPLNSEYFKNLLNIFFFFSFLFHRFFFCSIL